MKHFAAYGKPWLIDALTATSWFSRNRVGSVFEYTYAQFDEDVNRIANVFLSLDVQKGDFVALHLHSSPEFLMCLFGLAKIGAVAVPVNEQYLADETEYILDTAQVKCAVVEPLYLATYQELCKARS